MKIGFNEGCNRFCENHSVLEDLALCEKYGFDYIDVQSECLDRELAAGNTRWRSWAISSAPTS